MPTPTYNDYTGDGSNTFFAINFEYLEDEHVTVELDGVATSDFVINTAQPTKRVEMTTAPANGVNVRVRRQSQRDTDLVDFENGSVLTESELDRAYRHNRYLHQEIGELNDASLQKEAGGTDWDAGGSKIKNVGAPTLTADATTKQYVDDKVNQLSSGASAPPTKWVFTGTAGANTTYSVTDAEVNGDTAYDVSVDGSVLEPTTDYTVDPDTDTLTIVNTLSGGEDIVVIERGFGVAITGTIGADQLQSNAVTTAKINNSAVTTAKLADHSVTAVKISNTDPIFNVQTDGKVGIGTTNPGGPLHVYSTAADQLTLTRAINIIGSNTGASAVIHGGALAGTSPSTAGSIGFTLKDSDGTGSSGNSEGNIFFQTKNSGSSLSTKMVIDSSGNVGIGTTSPEAKLEVNAGASGTDVNTIRMDSDGGGAYNITCSDASSATPTWKHASGTSEPILFSAGGTDTLYIGGGNVGIGTISPSAPLEVASTTGGVVFPRLTTIQRDAISTPTDGETIFNTTTNQLESYNGSDWVVAGSGVRAKTSFQGVTTVTRNTNAESNISSVTRTGTGQYTITFSTAVSDPIVSIACGQVTSGAMFRYTYLLKDSGGSTVYSGAVSSMDISLADAGDPRDGLLVQILVF